MGDVIWLEVLTYKGSYLTFENVNISFIGDYILISKPEEKYTEHRVIPLDIIKSYKTKTK